MSATGPDRGSRMTHDADRLSGADKTSYAPSHAGGAHRRGTDAGLRGRRRRARSRPLYSRHRGPLFRFMLHQVREHGTAEELYQDVWQRVITARARYQPDARFSTWLFQIAHNRLTDHWRALQHRPPAPADADERTEREADPAHPGTTAVGLRGTSPPAVGFGGIARRSEGSRAASTGTGTDAGTDRRDHRRRPRDGEVPPALRARQAAHQAQAMTEPRLPNEALDEQEREIARILRALPGGEPSPALDARILRAATNAAAGSRRPRAHWLAPLGFVLGRRRRRGRRARARRQLADAGSEPQAGRRSDVADTASARKAMPIRRWSVELGQESRQDRPAAAPPPPPLPEAQLAERPRQRVSPSASPAPATAAAPPRRRRRLPIAAAPEAFPELAPKSRQRRPKRWPTRRRSLGIAANAQSTQDQYAADAEALAKREASAREADAADAAGQAAKALAREAAAPTPSEWLSRVRKVARGRPDRGSTRQPARIPQAVPGTHDPLRPRAAAARMNLCTLAAPATQALEVRKSRFIARAARIDSGAEAPGLAARSRRPRRHAQLLGLSRWRRVSVVG